MMDDEIAQLARKIHKERRVAVVIFSVLIIVVLANAGFWLWRSRCQFESFGETILPADTAPGLVYSLAVRDSLQIALPVMVMFFWVLLAGLLAFFLATTRLLSKETRLLLKVADKLTTENRNSEAS